MPLSLTSPAFPSGGRIPVKYTRDGQNVSPPSAWRDAPQQTRSFVVIVEDPDAPSGTFRHWAIYNIGPGETGLREGGSKAKPGTVAQGVNDFGNPHYDGPQPPKGRGPHHITSGSRPWMFPGLTSQLSPQSKTSGGRHAPTSSPKRRWSGSMSGEGSSGLVVSRKYLIKAGSGSRSALVHLGIALRFRAVRRHL
jgi:Raf kinase inhibitor-like YbhB/YbcL family protein